MGTQREELIVRAGFDNTALISGLRQANTIVGNFAQGVKNMFGGIFGAASAAGFVALIDRAFEKVKSFQSSAAKTGIDVESWQRLSQIANKELPDGAQKFDAAITKLNVNLGEGSEKFKKWGIHSRDAEGAMYEIADRMQAMSDPAERAAMAIDLMGKGGASLIPLLERGSKALKEMGSRENIFTKADMENISKAHQQFEDMENRVTIWAGKFISAIAEGAQHLGKISVSQGNMEKWSTDQINARMAKLAPGLGGVPSKMLPGHGEGMMGFTSGETYNPAYMALERRALKSLQDDEDKAAAEAAAEKLKKIQEQKNAQAELNDELEDEDKWLSASIKWLDKSIKKDGEKAKLQSEINNDALRMKKELESGTYLTVAQLAGTQYTKMIDRQYEPGGRFDLGGNAEAQELYRLTHGATAYDREYGTKANVDWDINRIKELRENLGPLLGPEQSLAAIEEHMKDTAATMKALGLKIGPDGLLVSIGSN